MRNIISIIKYMHKKYSLDWFLEKDREKKEKAKAYSKKYYYKNKTKEEIIPQSKKSNSPYTKSMLDAMTKEQKEFHIKNLNLDYSQLDD